eukprot:scaffold18161_cov56-Attheya_sp.AAC.8
MITGNREHDTLGDYTQAKLGKALPKAPAKIRDDNSESTRATRHMTRSYQCVGQHFGNNRHN